MPPENARCDIVLPTDMTGHPTVSVLLDVLQAAHLRREIDAIAGVKKYEIMPAPILPCRTRPDMGMILCPTR
jgi:hypothetical protein